MTQSAQGGTEGGKAGYYSHASSHLGWGCLPAALPSQVPAGEQLAELTQGLLFLVHH